MVKEVMKAMAGWEPVEDYTRRTGNLVLCGEGKVTMFTQREPWIEEFETIEIDGQRYLPTA